LDLDITTIKRVNKEVKNRFSELIKKAWEALGQDYFERLIWSMDSRVNAVLLAKGWYTKY
jgi:hypothetical protein